MREAELGRISGAGGGRRRGIVDLTLHVQEWPKCAQSATKVTQMRPKCAKMTRFLEGVDYFWVQHVRLIRGYLWFTGN